MFRRATTALLANRPDALAAYPALLNIDGPSLRLVPQMVQLLSLSKFVLQPQASQVHRSSAEPDADDSPPPSDGDDDSSLLLAGPSIFEKGRKYESKSIKKLCAFGLFFLLYRR
jgi:hypothetical protein